MAKKHSISLNSFVTRLLLMAFLGFSFIIIPIVIAFFMMFQTDTIAPANAGEIAAHQTIKELSEKGTFSDNFDTSYFNYIYFSKNGTVLSSSLKHSALKKTEASYKDINKDYSSASYLVFSDGSYCLFTWNYHTSFTNKWAREHLPTPEVLFSLLIIILLFLYSVFLIRFASKTLKKRLFLVNHASKQIAQQQLDEEIETKSGIKEFDQTLQSMEDMRVELKNALIEQWQSQQQKHQDLIALSHDIKTPLAIVSGNAELLIEDKLSLSQKEVAQTILNSSQKALNYLEILQHMSNSDLLVAEKKAINIDELLKEIDATLKPLAKQKGQTVNYTYPTGLNIYGDFFNLSRALATMGENAVTYSSKGDIQLSIFEKESFIYFSFEDTGPGFSNEGLKHATELFWQQEKSRTGTTNYGVGLALAKRVAESHDGSLILENTTRGAKVTLFIRKSVSDE